MIDEKLQYYRLKYSGIIRYLTTMVGVSIESALYIFGEIGADMSVWRDSDSLASWAGLSPSSNASAGKNKSTKIGKGGHYLKPCLCNVLWLPLKVQENIRISTTNTSRRKSGAATKKPS